MAVPAVVRYGFGYVQGADEAAGEMGLTDVTMNYVYGGQFFGDTDITAKMDTWYQGGTEVVFACGGGIYTSAAEAAKKVNGKVIGVDVDQSATIDGDYGAGITVTSAMGFNGIAATFLGGLNPIGTIFSSYFIQHITSGGAYLDKAIYPSQISDLISSLIIYLCGFVLFFKYRMKSQYANLLKSDSLQDLICIIKTSYLRNKARADQHKKLASIDDEYLHKAEKYLYDELSVALDMTYDQSKAYFNKEVEKASRS